ncbi:hypothetical protein L9F63_025530, partial [Diploptera punctata]
MESLTPLKIGLENLKLFVNRSCSNLEPWQIISLTNHISLAGVWVWEFIFQEESLVDRSKKTVFKLAHKKYQPLLRKLKEIHTLQHYQNNGKNHHDIIEQVDQYLSFGDFNWKGGFVSGAVYNFNPELIKLLTEVYGRASYTNPLHPDVFPGVCKMEAEVVRISANLFHGSSDSCGTMTTGGTESILMACKAYRDYARAVKGIRKPEMVIPVTAHPAFDKGGSYFGIRVKRVPVDPETTTVDIQAVKKAISKRTIMLVGSAPNFPYGTMDDIEAIAALGVEYNIPVHVDACLGGFVIAFMNDAGYKLPRFDFSLPGVTSISADTHKAPQFCVSTDWPGGVYGSPTVNGSRAGGIIAACWATMMYFGLEGYVDATRKIVETTKYMEKRLRKMDGIFVFGTPATSVIALGSKEFHIYRLSDALSKRGWNLNPLQFPPGLHLCVTYMHTAEGIADRFISDVQEELAIIMKDPGKPVEGKFAMYGMSHSIPDRSIVGDFTRFFLDAMYYTPRN